MKAKLWSVLVLGCGVAYLGCQGTEAPDGDDTGGASATGGRLNATGGVPANTGGRATGGAGTGGSDGPATGGERAATGGHGTGGSTTGGNGTGGVRATGG